MIADLINNKYPIRLITHNVMSVFSPSQKYLEEFLSTLKSSKYLKCGCTVSANSFICYDINIPSKYISTYLILAKYSNNLAKALEYISYLNLNYTLWTRWFQLSPDDILAIITVIKLVSSKEVILLDYIDHHPLKDKLYSLAYHTGLSDKLIIIPFKSITEAVNHSTCQCYIKPGIGVKVLPKFSNEFLNNEFNTSCMYYKFTNIKQYRREHFTLAPAGIKYTFIDLIAIVLGTLNLIFTKYLLYWRVNTYVP